MLIPRLRDQPLSVLFSFSGTTNEQSYFGHTWLKGDAKRVAGFEKRLETSHDSRPAIRDLFHHLAADGEFIVRDGKPHRLAIRPGGLAQLPNSFRRPYQYCSMKSGLVRASHSSSGVVLM